MSKDLIGQLRFLILAVRSALGGRSLKNAAGDRRVLRFRRRAVSTGPALAPSWARSRPRLRFVK